MYTNTILMKCFCFLYMLIGSNMNESESLSNLLQVCARKTEDFVRHLDNKHMVWLMEIEEAARKMFSK